MNKLPLTIKETQSGLLKKEYTAVDLVKGYLDNIRAKDKDLNSFLTIAENEAFESAKDTDQLIKKDGEKAFTNKPLLGVVVAHKDIFLTKGVRTTAASKVLESYVPVYSSTSVKRIQEAGAIVMGKLNMDAWAHGSSGENSDFGSTKNPWSKSHVPGGSSSGSGAALAANFSLITTGTDTCGSVRLPANYCGVYGFKPTYGAVSRYGVIAMASSLDSVGHFGRTAGDIRKVFNVTRGEDGKDATVKNFHDDKKTGKLTIGVPREFFGKGLNEEVRKSIEEALSVFEKDGYSLKEISLPHTKYGISVYYIVQPAEVSSNLGRYDGIRYGNTRGSFGDEAKRRIMLGSYVLSSGYYDAYYLRAMKVRSRIIEEINEAYKKVDVIIAPVAPTPPFKLGEKVDDPLQMYLTDIFAATANLSGTPALSVPFGFTKDKLPLGFQIMGPRFSEERIFTMAERFEKLTNYIPSVAKI